MFLWGFFPLGNNLCLITNDPPEHQDSRKEIAAVNDSRLENSVKNVLWGTEKKKKDTYKKRLFTQNF